MQSFSAPSSTESRLIPIKNDGKYTMKAYNPFKYESEHFFHNSVVREVMMFYTPINRNENLQDEGGLNNKFDSIHFIYVMLLYMQFMGTITPTPEEAEHQAILLTKYIRDGINKYLNKFTSILTIKEDLKNQKWSKKMEYDDD